MYNQLRKLRDSLRVKQNRSDDENQLLNELESLNAILDKAGFSLGVASSVCPTCGKSLK